MDHSPIQQWTTEIAILNVERMAYYNFICKKRKMALLCTCKRYPWFYLSQSQPILYNWDNILYSSCLVPMPPQSEPPLYKCHCHSTQGLGGGGGAVKIFASSEYFIHKFDISHPPICMSIKPQPYTCT